MRMLLLILWHISKEVDENVGTVIGMQVENETGMQDRPGTFRFC